MAMQTKMYLYGVLSLHQVQYLRARQAIIRLKPKQIKEVLLFVRFLVEGTGFQPQGTVETLQLFMMLATIKMNIQFLTSQMAKLLYTHQMNSFDRNQIKRYEICVKFNYIIILIIIICRSIIRSYQPKAMTTPNNPLSLEKIFNTQFHKSAEDFNKHIVKNPEWKLKNILKFPLTKFIIDGDQFFKYVWTSIDNAKHYFWITTYAMDSSPAADTTLYKLIDAAKRGVHVILFLDNVQSWAKQQLVQQFTKAGGKFMILNPQWRWQSIYGYFTKDVWRRHHQKLIVTDNKSIIGSSNIQGNYAGIRYGNSAFRDINMYSQNIILDQFRQHFIDTANQYRFDLVTGEQNVKTQNYLTNNLNKLKQFNKMYQNSQFYPIGKYKLLHNDQKNKIRQIQTDVLSKLKSANAEIKIIQSYHYTMSRFQNQMQKAITKRGLKPEIITTGKRDQPVFQEMKNQMLFQRLLRNGVSLYQTRQRLLHSKVYMFDKRWISMGSMNNDRWSWLINNQCNVLIDDQRIYEQINQYYQNLKKTCRQVKKGYKITANQAASINFWLWFLYLSEIVMSKGGPPEQDYIQKL